MNIQNIAIANNLCTLRKYHRLSQEQVAEAVGVSRQAVAKWESGDTLPDILNCAALADLFNVTLDNLVHYNEAETGLGIPQKDKHLFGTVTVGERGQIVLPKKARDAFALSPGSQLVVLGDTAPGLPGLALMKNETFLQMISGIPGSILP